MLVRFSKNLFFVTLIYAVGVAFAYLVTPSYLDHAEPLVAVTAWVSLKQGLPLFNPSNFGSAYNLMYGPLLFISHWPAFTLLGGSFWTSKITGFVFFLGCLWFLYKLKSLVTENSVRYLLAFLFLSWALSCDDFFYNNRADVFLLFWTLFAAVIFWSKNLSSFSKLILTSIAAALCFNYKIHGIIYVAPFVGALAIRDLKSFLIALVTFTAVAILPWLFLPGQFSIYFTILKTLSRNLGKTEIRQILIMNATMIAVFFSFYRLRFPKERFWLILFSLIAISLGSLFAMREGSGKNQMVPLIASYLNFFALAEYKEIQKKYVAAVILIFLYLFGCLVKDQKDIMQFFAQYPSLQKKKNELISLLASLPNHSVLWSYADSTYQDSYLRPQVYFLKKGSDFIVDMVTLMENGHGGIAFPVKAVEELNSCKAKYAIAPFGGHQGVSMSFYDTTNVFSDDWSKAFNNHFTKVKETEHYTLWKCH